VPSAISSIAVMKDDSPSPLMTAKSISMSVYSEVMTLLRGHLSERTFQMRLLQEE
jgi:hypothetical protein